MMCTSIILVSKFSKLYLVLYLVFMQFSFHLPTVSLPQIEKSNKECLMLDML